jgi:hypothetical protein
MIRKRTAGHAEGSRGTKCRKCSSGNLVIVREFIRDIPNELFNTALGKNQEVTITNKIYLTADDISDVLGVSKAFAYKMIKKLNTELTAQGYLTIAGKVSAKYFSEKVYGFNSAEGGDDRAGISRQ